MVRRGAARRPRIGVASPSGYRQYHTARYILSKSIYCMVMHHDNEVRAVSSTSVILRLWIATRAERPGGDEVAHALDIGGQDAILL